VSLPWPRCGNYDTHPAHPAHTADFSAPYCPGWTAEQKLVRDLITGVREYTHEHWMPREPLPEGLRVEMHPSVRRLLMVDPDLWERPGRERTVDDWLPVPAMISSELKPGTWRLVIITEEVLLEG
jgi:hypothetical protein